MDEYAITYFTLLKHSIKIISEEQYHDFIVASFPNLKKEDKKQIIDIYLKNMGEGEEKPSTAIIKKDRERLKALFSKKNGK